MIFNKFKNITLAHPTIIIDDDFALREIKPNDAECYFKYITHAEVQKFVPNSCIPQSILKAAADLQFLQQLTTSKNGIYWAISCRKNDEMIGTCGFETWNKRHARLELVYDLSPAYWGRKVTSKAVIKIIDFAFANMPINRIEALTTTDNLRSIALLKSLIFLEEGLLNQYRYFKSNFTDVYIFSKIKEKHIFESYNDSVIQEWQKYFHEQN